jgi:hypothetical protein
MFKLQFTTDNATFGETTEEKNAEIARTLRTLAGYIEQGLDSGTITDPNGNTTGSFDCNAPDIPRPRGVMI